MLPFFLTLRVTIRAALSPGLILKGFDTHRVEWRELRRKDDDEAEELEEEDREGLETSVVVDPNEEEEDDDAKEEVEEVLLLAMPPCLEPKRVCVEATARGKG
jgi:hypothetical protein